LDVDKEFILATLHRPSNVDDKHNLTDILDALFEVGEEKEVIFPAHPRTFKMMEDYSLLDKYAENMHIIKPLGYFDFLNLLGSACCVVTDSGGVQKEALILKTPCITVRDSTEWVETIQLGGNVLVSSNMIYKEVMERSSREFHEFMKKIKNPYGDGKTSEKILDYLKNKDG
jgi:UDP-N-acetylglucosamine 2-epimerase